MGGNPDASVLLEADRRFAAAVSAAEPANRGRVWAGWFAPDGRQIVTGRQVIGPGDVAALMGPVLATPGYELQWDPDTARIAEDGTLGWTTGRYVSRRTSSTGEPEESRGRYLTIWKRQPDGCWKVAVDTGVPD